MTTSPANIASRLAAITGPSHVHTEPADCGRYAVDGLVPAAVVAPSSAGEIAEIVRLAAAEKLALISCGSGSKLGIGMPPARYDIALDMTGLNQIAHYDPGDLTLSIDAGMSLATLATALYQHGQFLPLGVPYGYQSTVGGAIASGVDSPLRQFYGTARDFVIGAEFVNGAGMLTKSGGRVVKNVTGYDLHKLLIGSLGTLAVITRVNFRTFPLSLASRGFVVSFPTEQGALELRRRIAASPLSPTTLEILSPQMAQHFASIEPNSSESSLAPPGSWFRPSDWHLCVGFEGACEVCDRYARDLARLAEAAQATSTRLLEDAECSSLWHFIREAIPLLLKSSPAAAIFKIVQLPARLGPLFAQLRSLAEQAALPSALFARGCGVVYFALLPAVNDAASLRRLAEAASAVFQLCAKESASATLPWCPLELKRVFCVPDDPAGRTVSIWGPPRPDLALMRRLKAAFDPQNIFAPGRFLGGI